MIKKLTSFILVLNYILVLLALPLLIASVTTTAWWIRKFTDVQYETGLMYRQQHNLIEDSKQYTIRDNLLQFLHEKSDPNGDHRDIVLVCLLISIAIDLFTVFIYCFLFKPRVPTSVLLTVVNAVFISFSAVFSCGGMIYYEIKFRFIYRSIDRSICWSYILAWIGSSLLVISMVLSVLLIFLVSGKCSKKTIITRNTAYQTTSNKALERTENVIPKTLVIFNERKAENE